MKCAIEWFRIRISFSTLQWKAIRKKNQIRRNREDDMNKTMKKKKKKKNELEPHRNSVSNSRTMTPEQQCVYS